MKLANIMLAIGGGRDNTIPKYGVTAAEIGVLRAIHGEDAVFDVEPTTENALNENGGERTNRQELNRLKYSYGKATDTNGVALVENLYPGAAARVFEGFDELDLPDDYFKAVGRVSSVAAEKPKARPDAKPKTKAELIAYAETNGIEVDKSAKVGDIRDAIEAAEAPKPASDEDDLDDIDDLPPVGDAVFE